MLRNHRGILACGAMLLGCGPARPDDSPIGRQPAWPDTFLTRVEAVALLQTLNGSLLSHDSATRTLEHWCDIHRMASPARIVAVRDSGVEKPVSAEQRRELAVTAAEPVRYRRVRLLCGTVELSEADNWYVPGRLTTEMNKALETSDMPFGKVVKALRFQRRTLSSTMLWAPLPDGWEMNPIPPAASIAVLSVPSEVLRHRALLTLPDGTPFSEVEETYMAGVLAFRAPGQ
jgi:chorismate-pyruvate lyase